MDTAPVIQERAETPMLIVACRLRAPVVALSPLRFPTFVFHCPHAFIGFLFIEKHEDVKEEMC